MGERCETLTEYTCYDLLPTSIKVVAFDTKLRLKKALSALLQHGLQSAPLWDSTNQQYTGMLTVTDFIQLILYYVDRSTTMEQALLEIEELTLEQLRSKFFEFTTGFDYDKPSKSITVSPQDTLYRASRLLIEHRLHRLPVLEITNTSQSILTVLTQNKILRYVAQNNVNPSLLCAKLSDIKIGTFTNVISATIATPLIQILRLFVAKRISAVPIVDDDGFVINLYEKYDVLSVAKDGLNYNLEMPISEALSKRSTDFQGIHSCTMDDTLGQMLDAIRKTQVRRFVVLENKKLKGLVSLSDILRFLIS